MSSLDLHRVARNNKLTILERLDKLFDLDPWIHTGRRSQRFNVSLCQDGRWYGAFYPILEEELEGLDYDLFGPSFCCCFLNIVFYSELPKSHHFRNKDGSRACMSRKEIRDAGCIHPFVEKILNDYPESIPPTTMVSTRKIER